MVFKSLSMKVSLASKFMIYSFDKNLKKSIIFSNASNVGLKYPRSKAMYENTNRLVEKISKFISFLIVYISIPAFVLPKAFYCFFIYFTTDLGPDAFALPIPTW